MGQARGIFEGAPPCVTQNPSHRGIRLRSADFQSAVSRVSNPLAFQSPSAKPTWKSAIQQTGSLRYINPQGHRRVSEEFSDAALVLVGHGSTVNADSAAPACQHADELRRRNLFAQVQEAFWKQEPYVCAGAARHFCAASFHRAAVHQRRLLHRGSHPARTRILRPGRNEFPARATSAAAKRFIIAGRLERIRA